MRNPQVDVPASDKGPLSVGDLFCGAGGFSEGFRQAGLVTKWAVDFWKPAILTYQKNHPETRVYAEDIESFPIENLPPVDIVIGSPPCTQFSPANRGGNGDKQEGLALARRFFDVVQRLKPRYWILENVPALRFSLAEELSSRRVETPSGVLTIPRAEILHAEDFGTPQRRHRLFLGDFPGSTEELGKSSSGLTLRDVVQSLPDPTRKPLRSRLVKDPNYPSLRVPVRGLRDHFEDTRWKLRSENIELARAAKEQHRWLGKMVFPDDLDKPSRTITGAHSTTSRSTIIFRYRSRGINPYRTLTLREAATIQGFPLTYQFWHDSFGGKDKLVGNAVPVPVARGLATAILRQEGLPIPRAPLLSPPRELAPPVAVKRSRMNRFGPNRRFRSPVAIDVRHECRVELDNRGLKRISGGPSAPRTWATRLYLGYAKEYLCFEVTTPEVKDILRQLRIRSNVDAGIHPGIVHLIAEAHRIFDGRVPDGNELQARWTERVATGIHPISVIGKVATLVNREFPLSRWGKVLMPEEAYLGAIGHAVEGGRKAPRKPVERLPVRAFAAVAALTVACDAINSCPVEPAAQAVGTRVPMG